MMQLLAQLLGQQESSGIGTFNASYVVSGAGTSACNGTYYAMMSPDVNDEWGNPVYMNTNTQSYLYAYIKQGNVYGFKISAFYPSNNTDYYTWAGFTPNYVSTPIVLGGGTAPFPTITE